MLLSLIVLITTNQIHIFSSTIIINANFSSVFFEQSFLNIFFTFVNLKRYKLWNKPYSNAINTLEHREVCRALVVSPKKPFND